MSIVHSILGNSESTDSGAQGPFNPRGFRCVAPRDDRVGRVVS